VIEGLSTVLERHHHAHGVGTLSGVMSAVVATSSFSRPESGLRKVSLLPFDQHLEPCFQCELRLNML
jgi:hypothetical protein